ncbi:metallo-beta-lactamase [Defluviimonas sp. 20V17]|uniref:Glyoxylase, beta-lactamase superfamily II n=1 Tax=Allgaiera indica TaxID=765699 RepID=A0AAN5A0H9_9RHOB|nr:MBL fold metallo-hydrolase [Allgaiera indica]KDB05417.1 metallo-beta-lactamase [Defluviimonas sp. 20V17]GHE04156.1 MBL fold metallo-hydrolase [Allgaiera indica]SDX50041.1 Glyoxylase, beta-lactamase superfamily II [Allgaiera indica]
MKITRRQMLGACAAATLARPVWAGVTLEMGQVKIETLSDGHLVLPRAFMLGDAPQPEADEILLLQGVEGQSFTPPCNLTLLRDGTNTILFDAGSGPGFQPTAGKLLAALDAVGVSPGEVTHVVFTHGHPDHLWGVLDDFDEPLFAEAQYLMGADEFAYWRDPDTLAAIGPARQAFAVGARRRLDLLAERITEIKDGQEILPGVTAQATYGHTPGHMSYVLHQGSDSVMVLGDAVANAHLAFLRPGWHWGSDQDPDQAAQARVALLDQIVQDKMRLIGFHLPGPGIGRAEKAPDGYRFIAEA